MRYAPGAYLEIKMKATLVRKTEVYIRCAECGDETSHCVSNIEPGMSFGPWYCNNCGTGIRGYINGPGAIDIEEVEYRRVPAYVLLRVLPQTNPIFLVVQGADLVPKYEQGGHETAECVEGFLDGDEFFYSYASDPSITLRNTLAVIIGTEFAPSGVFQHVSTKQAPHVACEQGDQNILTEVFCEFIKIPTGEPAIKGDS